MRLTEKNKNGEYFLIAESKVFDEEQQCINKLGQLEDKEALLGVELSILFQALTKGIYYKDYFINL